MQRRESGAAYARKVASHVLARLAVVLVVAAAAGACGSRESSARTAGQPAAPRHTVVEWVRGLLAGVPRDSVIRLSPGDTLRVSAPTMHFYRWRLYRAAWTDGERLLPEGRALLEAIGRATDDGLDPRRYGYALAEGIEARLDSADLTNDRRAALLGSLDVVLTEGFSRYARDLLQGTLDPEKAGLDWRLPHDTTHEENALKDVRNGMPPDSVVARLRPHVPYYGRLMGALARYRAVAARGGWPAVPAPGGKMRPGGDGGASVVALRKRLMAGDDPTEARLAQTGAARPSIFDDSLQAALAHFQRRNGIADDGVLGPNTLKELNHTVQDRIADLRLNLDRWRWLPRDLGSQYVLVNVAGFELEAIRDGEPVLSMNVVVGKQGWHTPIFADTIRDVIANPYWNVPESILKEEVLPGIERDPDYLASHDFEVVRGDRVVSPSAVDLSATGSYRVRQRPGPTNALGDLKFIFPNHFNVYLHGTPAHELFSETQRAFSHGCIRLQRPRELADLLLAADSRVSPDSLDTLLASGKNHWIRLDPGVPIYILYFTAWADRDGTVRFLHDVYGRDAMLRQVATTR